MQQHFGENHVHLSNRNGEESERKLLMLSSAITMNHLNPLSSLNDQVRPVNLELSEKYQNLLHDYCTQPVEDFLQSQFYLWILIAILVTFSICNRKQLRRASLASPNGRTPLGGGAKSRGKAKSKSRSRQKQRRKQSADKVKIKIGGSRGEGHQETSSAQSEGRCLSSGLAQSEPFFAGTRVLVNQQEEAASNSYATGHSASGDSFLPTFEAQSSSKLAQQFQTPSSAGPSLATGNGSAGTLAVVLVCGPVYFASLVLHVHLAGWAASQDLVASVSMVLIAFTVLIGTFLPVLRGKARLAHSKGPLAAPPGLVGRRFGPTLLASGDSSFSSSSSSGSRAATGAPGSANSTSAGQQQQQQQRQARTQAGGAFAMFPEFAPTGLRRPASLGGDSLSHFGGVLLGGSSNGHRSRPPFANAKESRRNLGAALANLGPSAADSLRSMGVYQAGRGGGALARELPPTHQGTARRRSTPAQSALEANVYLDSNGQPEIGGDEELPETDLGGHSCGQPDCDAATHHLHHHHQQQQQQQQHDRLQHKHSRHSLSGDQPAGTNEKRLIMLDVDPCCPRHGVAAAWAHKTGLVTQEMDGAKRCALANHDQLAH